MALVMLNESDFLIVGGKERKFVAIPLSKWNQIIELISDSDIVDEYIDLDVQTVRIELEK